MSDNPLFDMWRMVYGRNAPFSCNERWSYFVGVDRHALAQETEPILDLVDEHRDREAKPETLAEIEGLMALVRDRQLGATEFVLRRLAVHCFAWAVPTDEAVKAIASYGDVVEVGAGRGYWARLIADVGVDVAAFDLQVENKLYYEVQAGGVDSVEGCGDRTLLLCWPPYSKPMAHEALLAYEKAGGRCIVYVGEGRGGCTGTDRFHSFLEERWRCVEDLTIPQWWGLHDYLSVWERL